MDANIYQLDQLAKLLAAKQDAGEKIVLTNGCFDIIHIGHVRYLKEAKSLGDKLVVALNSDQSVKELKGDLRPVICEEERAEMLAALEAVDYVVIFSEPTADNVINRLKPNLYVKGGDYQVKELPEAESVANYGGEIKILSEIKGVSTTELIKKIQQLKL